MENGVSSVDASTMVEEGMEKEVPGCRIEEKTTVGCIELKDLEEDSSVEKKALVRSHESKDSEGDLVFEDSIATEIPAVYLEDVLISVDVDLDTAGDSDRFVAVHDKTDNEFDFEEFKEAIGVPNDGENQNEQSASIEDKGGVFVGAEPVDKAMVGEAGNVEDVIEIDGRDKLDRVENDVTVSEGENKVRASEVATADGMETIKEEEARKVDVAAVLDKVIQEQVHEADQKSSVIVEKSQNGFTDGGNFGPTLAYETSGNGHADVEEIMSEEELRIGDAEFVPPVGSKPSQTVEFIQSFDQAEKAEEVKEVFGLADNGRQDEESYEDEGGKAAVIQTDNVDESRYNSVTLDCKLEDEKVCGGTEEEIAAGMPITLHDNDESEELKNTISSNGENKEEKIKELGCALATSNSDEHLRNGKPESSLELRVETLEVKKMADYEDAPVESAEKVQEIVADLGVEIAEVSKFQPAVKLVEARNADIKLHELREATVEKVKSNTQGENGVGEIKPVSNTSASSAGSENSAPAPARPAGLGRAAPLFESAPRVVQQPRVNGTSLQTQNQIIEDSTNGDEENDETREKLQMIRVKFLRLAHRLGQTPHNVVVAQVLYRLGLAEQLRGRNGGRVPAFSFDRASAMAEQLEAAGQEPLDFSCTIMVLGKSGVGKSATINSIFDEVKFGTDAFQHGTKKVQDVIGTVQGIKVRVIDTPGLLPSWSDQRQNEKILLSVKRFIKKTPPDIVLYLDRLDMQTRDLGDMPLLRTITDIFGPSIWFNAIVVLTHAASAPPDGPNGTATSYDMFVTQRSHVVQQAIRHAAGDMRLMNPVSLVENHSACRKNRAGQRVLPNGQVWKPHLLLLSFASKILAEANTLLKLQDSPPGKPFATRTRAPPLPFLLSSLLQSRPQLKLPEEQFGDNDDDVLDDDLDGSSDSDDESEYDELPPFKRLTKAQLANLMKDQKKAYYAELEYREKLFMKKQLKEEKKRQKIMRKMAASANESLSEYNDNVEEENGGAASVPVPMPDLALPASFDSDNPTHRYRSLDSPNQWIVRPVLDTHGWDHDIGYEGVNVERVFAVKQQIPVSFSGQITKDKKDATVQMEIASSIKHGESKATSVGFDMQTLGKDIAYTLRGETKFSNYRRNKAAAGLSVTMLGDTLTAGVKIEDKLMVNKRLKIVASGGAMTGRGDVAYGGSFEATLRDKDHPLGRSLSTLGLSVMDWHGDLAVGGNLQSQIPVGRSTNLIARANLNNRGSGQVSIRLNSSEQLQIALIGLIPLLRKALGHSQQSQYG